MYITVNKEQIVTILIVVVGLFGGLVGGGPIASLLDYHAPPVKHFWLFIIPDFIGFTCTGMWYIMEDQGNRNDDRKLCRHF